MARLMGDPKGPLTGYINWWETLEGSWYYWLLALVMKSWYKVTSSADPIIKGTRWWISVGWMLKIRSCPVVAIPPACSTMKAMGLASHISLSLPLGFKGSFTSAG